MHWINAAITLPLTGLRPCPFACQVVGPTGSMKVRCQHYSPFWTTIAHAQALAASANGAILSSHMILAVCVQCFKECV